MMKTYTCIVCPNGCDIEVTLEGNEIVSLEGHLCPRGEEYVRNELTAPMRTIASSVLVKGGEMPLASVRTDRAIPKEKIGEVMEAIKKVTVTAPIEAGTIVLENVCGLDCNIIATRSVK